MPQKMGGVGWGRLKCGAKIVLIIAIMSSSENIRIRNRKICGQEEKTVCCPMYGVSSISILMILNYGTVLLRTYSKTLSICWGMQRIELAGLIYGIYCKLAQHKCTTQHKWTTSGRLVDVNKCKQCTPL